MRNQLESGMNELPDGTGSHIFGRGTTAGRKRNQNWLQLAAVDHSTYLLALLLLPSLLVALVELRLNPVLEPLHLCFFNRDVMMRRREEEQQEEGKRRKEGRK